PAKRALLEIEVDVNQWKPAKRNIASLLGDLRGYGFGELPYQRRQYVLAVSAGLGGQDIVCRGGWIPGGLQLVFQADLVFGFDCLGEGSRFLGWSGCIVSGSRCRHHDAGE